MQLLLLLVIALTITVALIPPLANVAGRFRLLDRPGERKVHAEPIPRIGGIAMVAGTLVPLLMTSLPPEWRSIYLGVALLLVMGLADDRFDLPWWWKLAVQVIACVLAIGGGGVSIESLTFTERIELPTLLASALSLLFLVGVTNAINLSDGLDGLAGGTTLLSVLAIGWISFSGGDFAVASITAALAGALLGFLRFNTHPARIFMGDSGSQVLGFLAGVVAIKATQGPTATVSAALPLLLLAWPILDTLTVMIERIRNGRSPFSADKRHFHHRLLSLGFDHHQSVLIIYAVQAALFVLAFLLRYESDLLIGGAFALVAVLVIGSLEGARVLGWHWGTGVSTPSGLARRLRWLGEGERLQRLCRFAMIALLALYGGLVAFAAHTVSRDIGVLAAALIVALALSQGVALVSGKRKTSVMLLRLALAVAAAMLVYLDQKELGALGPRSGVALTLFAVLALLVLLRFRLAGERRFAFTTLDALVLFVAVIMPIVAGPGAGSIGLGILKLVGLGYAIEFAFEEWRVARGGALAATVLLGVIALRSVVPM